MTKECVYKPDCTNVWWDGNDVKHETDHASTDYGSCCCSECAYCMIGGQGGWFDEEDDGHGGLVLTPRFSYCPNCGAKVVCCGD